MSRTVIGEETFPEIIRTYNNEGKTGAYDLLRSRYGIKRPYFVISRIKKCGKYNYDVENDRFVPLDEAPGEQIFMDLDELCSTPAITPSKVYKPQDNTRQEAMEQLVKELISDKLLSMSRYINMDTSTRTILIDETSLSADGYRIITH